jgi:phosphoribosylanthranilate isomerase
MQPWRIKICGVTSPEDAQAIVAAGADAMGLNFFEGSKRYVDPDEAVQIARGLPKDFQVVGVFVNASASQIRAIAGRVPLDVVQLHGDEPPEIVSQLADMTVARAFRCGEEGLNSVVEYLDRARSLGGLPQFILLDALDPQQYGGTGRTLDWNRLETEVPRLGGVSWVLAGGLTPENVGRAIRQLQPSGVDTASGVESAPGRKDPDRVRAFVDAAREAFA